MKLCICFGICISSLAQKKHLPTMWEAQVRSLGQEDPLEKEMAPHFSTLAWKSPWTEKPGRLQSVGSQRVRHDGVTSLSLSPCLSSKWFHLRLNFFPFLKSWADNGSKNQYSYQLFDGWGMIYLMPSYLKNAYCGRGAWWNSLSLEVSLLSD